MLHLFHLPYHKRGESSTAHATREKEMGYVKRNRCTQCHGGMTWAEQKKQWGRMVRAGTNEVDATAAQPRCQKCTTAYLKGQHEHAVT